MTSTENSWEQPSPAPKKPFYKRWWFITIAVILALLAAFAAWIAIEVNRVYKVQDQMIEDCKAKVEEQAKYPGGVEFVTVEIERGEEVHATDLRRAIHGWVDFPNGFGTPVRHSFICPANYSDPDNPEISAIVKPKN